jgi:hypothetical protein
MLQSFSVGGMWTHSESFYDRHNPIEFGKATFSLLGQLLQQLPVSSSPLGVMRRPGNVVEL